MKHLFKIALVACAAVAMIACGPTDTEKAQSRLDAAKQMAQEGRLNQAKIELDSIHILFAREVAVRRQAVALADSISYVENQRTLAYSDSVLQTLLPQVDPLMKKFSYEKDERYEKDGKYVHRLLRTEQNMNRCYIQAYVSDQRVTTLKSYYFGSKPLAQTDFVLSADSLQQHYSGTSHCFNTDGYHSIMNFEGEDALAILSFIASYPTSRLKVELSGRQTGDKTEKYIYYLSDTEKAALIDTYQLGILMRDIRQLEENIRIASAHIEKYEAKK